MNESIRQPHCDLAHIALRLVLACFSTAFVLTPTQKAHCQTPEETIVTKKKDKANQEVITDGDRNSAQPHQSLGRLKGVTIQKMGGPLSPSQTLIQGFSGQRTGLIWDGFSLADPTGGFMDLSEFPIFATETAWVDPHLGPGLGGSVHATTQKEGATAWKMQWLTGAQNTQKWAFKWFQKITPQLQSLTAVQMGRTDGNFEFQPKNQEDKNLWEERKNNDQARQALLQWIRFKSARVKQTFLFLFNHHEGGVPGFAANPFPSLRGESRHLLLGSQTQWPTLLPGLQLQMQIQQKERHSFDALTPFLKDSVESYAYNWTASWQKPLPHLKMVFKTAPNLHLNAIQETAIARRGFFIPISAKQVLGNNLFNWELWQQLVGEEDFELLPNYGFKIGTGALPHSALSMGVRQKARAPSLREMYAPTGFVLGNPDLAPEKTQDVFADLHVTLHPFHFEASFLYARSEDLIFYVNQNAFELKPINTGETERIMGALRGHIRLFDYVLLQAGYDAFHTEVKATQAPLPGIPPHTLWGQATIGPKKATRLQIHHYYRTETTGDLYGALKVDPYHLTNIQLIHPVNDLFSIYANCDNLFDVGYARDLYFLPLPRRQIFISFEAQL